MKRIISSIFVLLIFIGISAQGNGSLGHAYRNSDCNGITSILEPFDNISVNSLPDCWSKIYPSNVEGPKVDGRNTDNGLQSKAVIFKGSHPQFLVLPRLDIPLSGLQLKFKINKEGIKSGTMQVGYMSDPTDSTTFVPLENYNNSNIYKIFIDRILYFDNVPDNGGANRFIAFRYGNVGDVIQNTSYYYWIDDVEVGPVASCPQPSNVTVTDATTTSISLSWSILAGSSAEWELEYKEASADNWTAISPNVTTNPEYTISGLTPNTPYNIRVRTVCGASQQSDYTYTVGDVYTPCEDISTLNETFENVSGAIPDCWSAITTLSYSPRIVTSSNGNGLGSNALQFSGTSGTSGQFLVTPKFNVPLSTLQLRFKLNSHDQSNSKFQVGYMSDPSDINTFVVIKSYRPDEYKTFKTYVLQLNSIPDNSGTNRYLAFRYGDVDGIIQPTYYNYWLDDIELMTAPSCLMVSDLTASALTSSTVDISFTANNGEQAWQYVITDDMSITDPSALTPIDVTTNPFTITGLNAITEYRVWVRSDCGSADGFSDYSSVTFTTDCGAVNIGNSQWTEDFASYTSGNIPPCWIRTKPYVYWSKTYPYVSDANGKSLSFGGNQTQIITTPIFFEEVNTLEIEFDLMRTSVYAGQFEVGVLSDPNDENSFVVIQDITSLISDNNSYHRIAVSLASASTGNHYIAFRQITNANGYYYLDNIDLHVIPTCPRPSGITTGTIFDTVATITWTPGASETLWQLEYKESTDSVWTSIDNISTSSYTINGLTAQTNYKVRVKSVCVEGVDESYWTQSITFKTACAIETLPFVEDFSDSHILLSSCWKQYKGLAADVFEGQELQSGSRNWNYGTENNGLAAGKAQVNIYGTSTKYWLVTPQIEIPSSVSPILEFDLALTQWNSPMAPTQVGTDDKFMVIVSTDGGSTWSGDNATVWAEDGTGDYLMSSITNTSNHVSLNIPHTGIIRIAFYVESSASNADMDLHLDNIYLAEAAPITIPPIVTTQAATDIQYTSATLNKNVVVDPSEPVVTEGWKYKAITDNSWSSTTSGSLTGLESNTEYEFYAFATTSLNSNGYNGDTLRFTTLSYVHPIVTTQAATDVQYTSATLNKNVVVDPSEPVVTEGWKYKATTDNSWSSTTSGSLTGLESNTEYEFYAFATTSLNSNGYNGDTLRFTTLSYVHPIVTTQAATDVQYTSATLNKNVVVDPSEPVVTEGWKYKAITDNSWSSTTSGSLTGLESNTEYEFYAFATTSLNPNGYNGDTLRFTTLSYVHPIVTTQAATDIQYTSATLNKNVVVDPSEPVVTEGWKYKAITDNSWSSTASGSLTGLESNTEYEFYAFATTSLNPNGYTGDTLRFTTLSYVHPIVTTQAATDIQYTSATLNKNVVVDPSEPVVTEGWKYKAITDNSWSSTASGSLTGLESNTEYEFYAFATTSLNPNGYKGDTLTFTTLSHTMPLVTTQVATNITYNSATLNKTVVAGSENITSEGFKYKLSGATDWTTVADGNLTGLQPNTEYEFKAYASTPSYPNIEGEVLSFRTLEHSVGIDLVDCNVKIYPNPANEVVTIQIDGLDSGAEITLFDLQGKILINQTLPTGSNSLILNVADLADATYIVRIKSDKINIVKRLIIKK